MRLRNIQGARDAIEESPLVVHKPEKAKGNWRELFGNTNPIRIEIGMGKGKFIHELAEKNPKVNYIGIEKYSSVLLRALQKMEAFPVPNLLFLRMDAENITEVFDTGEVERIYLNFSDPFRSLSGWAGYFQSAPAIFPSASPVHELPKDFRQSHPWRLKYF